MKATAFLPVWVRHLPISAVMSPMGHLKPHIRHYVDQGVVRVKAGPLCCHVMIDVRRPYFRPEALLEAPGVEARA